MVIYSHSARSHVWKRKECQNLRYPCRIFLKNSLYASYAERINQYHAKVWRHSFERQLSLWQQKLLLEKNNAKHQRPLTCLLRGIECKHEPAKTLITLQITKYLCSVGHYQGQVPAKFLGILSAFPVRRL